MSDDGRIRRVSRPDGSIAEVVIAAPIAELRWGGRTMDVLAKELEREYAPPTAEETAEAALAIASAADSELEKLRILSSTMATLVVALARRTIRDGRGLDEESLLLGRSELEAARGGKVGMRQTADGDVILRIRDRAERPVEPEEMRI